MPYGIAIGVGVAYSGYQQGKAAEKAAETSAAGQERALQLEQKQYEQTRQDYMPWLESGKKALGSLNELMGMSGQQRGEYLRQMPGYQFRLEEGLKAIRRGSLAGSKTGNTYRGLMEYGQQYASDAYNQEFNRLSTMAGAGQVATQNVGQLGAISAGQQGSYLTGAANARAAGIMGKQSAYSGALGQLAGMYGGNFLAGSSGGGRGGGDMSSYYGGGRVAPGGSFGTASPYPGGYGDAWTDY